MTTERTLSRDIIDGAATVLPATSDEASPDEASPDEITSDETSPDETTSDETAVDEPADPAPRPRDDRPGWASITACPNGPLLVRGDVEILLATGEPAPRRRSTVALCRCGASGIKPYCDGSHKIVGFRTDDEPV